MSLVSMEFVVVVVANVVVVAVVERDVVDRTSTTSSSSLPSSLRCHLRSHSALSLLLSMLSLHRYRSVERPSLAFDHHQQPND